MNGKLVRDRIPEIIRATGHHPTIRQAHPDELSQLLIDKLGEEVQEYKSDRTIDELADIVEVVHALAATHGLDRDALEAVRHRKYAERGGFTAGYVLIGSTER